MRGRGFLRLLRSPSRAEPVACALVIAVLAQLWFVAPLALAMTSAVAAGEASCHAAEEPGAPSPPASHDHAQCLLCTGGAGPLLATPALPDLVPPTPTRIEESAAAATPCAAPDAACYRSRAPPCGV